MSRHNRAHFSGRSSDRKEKIHMQSHSDRNPCVPLKEAGGPLHSYISDFTDSLANRGYSKEGIAYKFPLVRAFGQWMRQSQIKMEGFTQKRIPRFICHRAKRK